MSSGRTSFNQLPKPFLADYVAGKQPVDGSREGRRALFEVDWPVPFVRVRVSFYFFGPPPKKKENSQDRKWFRKGVRLRRIIGSGDRVGSREW